MARLGARAWVATLAGLASIGLAAAACSSSSPTDTAGPSGADSASPAASPAASPSGTAQVTITGPFGTATWTGGTCDQAGSGEWLAVNAGDANGSEYVGILIGRSPYGPGDASPLASGGTYSGSSVLVTWKHGGGADGLPRGSATAQVASTLESGTFTGQLATGETVSGSFDCLASASPSASEAPSSSPSASPSPSARASGSAKPTRSPKATARPSASASPSPTPRPS